MIIALNSYISGGKDTSAKIIQALYPEYNWQVKKFAHPLKQIVSILTGISVEDLDKQEVKNSKMSDEWTCWKLSFDTDHNGISHNVWKVFSTEDEARDYMDENYIVGGLLQQYLPTYREFMQIVGTDLFRDKWHPDTWVNVLMKDYKKLYLNDPWYNDKDIFSVSELDEMLHPPILPNWVIADLRFKNEYKAIKDRNGITIHIKRYKPTDFHDSEIQLNDCKFDYTVYNTKDISYLTDQIKEVYNDIRRTYSEYEKQGPESKKS